MGRDREINPVLASLIVVAVVGIIFLAMWLRAQPNTANLPNRPPPGFGGASTTPR